MVYWFGHVDDQEYDLPEGVDILDGTFFEDPFVPYPYVPVNQTKVEDVPEEPAAADGLES